MCLGAQGVEMYEWSKVTGVCDRSVCRMNHGEEYTWLLEPIQAAT